MKIVYGTFDSEGLVCYKHNDKWFPFSGRELLFSHAEHIANHSGMHLTASEIKTLGLNNPPFLVRFEIPE